MSSKVDVERLVPWEWRDKGELAQWEMTLLYHEHSLLHCTCSLNYHNKNSQNNTIIWIVEVPSNTIQQVLFKYINLSTYSTEHYRTLEWSMLLILPTRLLVTQLNLPNTLDLYEPCFWNKYSMHESACNDIHQELLLLAICWFHRVQCV